MYTTNFDVKIPIFSVRKFCNSILLTLALRDKKPMILRIMFLVMVHGNKFKIVGFADANYLEKTYITIGNIYLGRETYITICEIPRERVLL